MSDSFLYFHMFKKWLVFFLSSKCQQWIILLICILLVFNIFLTRAFKCFNGFWPTVVIMLIDVHILSLLLVGVCVSWFSVTSWGLWYCSFPCSIAFYVISPSNYGDNGPIYCFITSREWWYSNFITFSSFIIWRKSPQLFQ